MKEQLRPGHRRQGKWILVPLEDITTPKAGRTCHGPAYWMVTENDEVIFFETYGSPQCNAEISLVERWLRKSLGSTPDDVFAPPAVRVVLLSMAYTPRSVNE